MELPGLSLDLSSLAGLGKENRPNPAELYDCLILGGGPAAMTAAIYAARKVLKAAILTKDFGGQVGWTSEVENYLGFQTITGKELVNRFVEQVQQFELPVALGERVVDVKRDGGGFLARSESGTAYRGRTAIVATGKRDKLLNVPGERELTGHGVAYCATCDAPFYRGKSVAVVGGGNSAFSAALDLLRVEARVVLLNWAEGWQADGVLLESVRRAGEAVQWLDHQQVLRIEGQERVAALVVKDRQGGEERSLPVDGVFIEIGLVPNSEPVRHLVKLNDQGEVVVDCHCRTDVDGLFGAGDVTTVPQKQIIISAGEGAKAALAAYEYLLRRG